MSETIAEITEIDLSPQDKTLWLKALSAVQLNNQAYAVNLILPVVQKNPGFLEGRSLLRKCQAVSADDTSSSGTTVFGIKMGGKAVSSKIKSLVKKSPIEALGEIEKELCKDPFNPGLNNILHDCAAQLAMIGTAEFALETIHQHRPENTKVLHKLASFYMGEKKFIKAAGVYHTISKEDPTDSIAIKGEKDCMAKSSMMEITTSEGGVQNLRMRDDSLRKKLEKESKTGLTKDQLIERRDALMVKYTEDQNDFPTVMRLAETYESLGDYSDSFAFYNWAFELSENDNTILSRADAMKTKANTQEVITLEEALALDPANTELETRLTDVKQRASQERIAECEARVKENPTDGLLRYELGKAYFDSGMADEAIPHLQQAKSNPAIETKVLLLLGRAFDLKGMTDMAISQLARANERLLAMDGIKKEVLYQLALLYQKEGSSDDYLVALKQVYEVDYNYRDVARRVEDEYNK